MKVPIRLGEVLRFEEPDYKYGLGPIALRVTQVLNTSSDPEWIELKGVQVASNGQDIAERLVMVRVSAIKRPRS